MKLNIHLDEIKWTVCRSWDKSGED